MSGLLGFPRALAVAWTAELLAFKRWLDGAEGFLRNWMFWERGGAR